MKHVYSFKAESIEIEGKLIDYFKDLTALFSDLSTLEGFFEIKQKQKRLQFNNLSFGWRI